MLTYDDIKDLCNTTNPFANNIGIKVMEIQEGYSRVEVPVHEGLLNVAGAVHGGMLFTLCDVACGAAASSYQYKATTVDSSFHFLRPALNCTRLRAIAKELKHGKRVMVYEVEVFNEEETMLCKGVYTMMQLKFPFEKPKAEEK
jgi:acyl-CoA thioesterase